MWIISTVNSFNGSAMKKSKFSDSQIMAILKQAEAGIPVCLNCAESMA
jgi:hypothetical protein